MNFSITLSIRIRGPKNEIVVRSVDYYDCKGERFKRFIQSSTNGNHRSDHKCNRPFRWNWRKFYLRMAHQKKFLSTGFRRGDGFSYGQSRLFVCYQWVYAEKRLVYSFKPPPPKFEKYCSSQISLAEIHNTSLASGKSKVASRGQLQL